MKHISKRFLFQTQYSKAEFEKKYAHKVVEYGEDYKLKVKSTKGLQPILVTTLMW